MVQEKVKHQYNGWLALLLLIVLLAVIVTVFIFGIRALPFSLAAGLVMMIGSILALAVNVILFTGLFTLEPNEAMVLLLFGKYMGTEKQSGFLWANPLYTRKRVSLRARNFDSDKLKVNDKKGNPIEISTVVVWKVENTAQAFFEVDSFLEFVHVQSESALRHMASHYAYDDSEGETVSLRSSLDEVSDALGKEIQDRVQAAGVTVLEARINHLAYAQEIAGAMLQRQQAEAIIEARQKIVDGAVGMVQMALGRLKDENVLDLDEERKANMVSNLMVVLCSDKATTPIVNAGSLY